MQTANIRIRECVSGCLLEVKSYEKSFYFQAQKVVAVAYRRGGRLLEVPTVRLYFDWGSLCVLDWPSLILRVVVAYKRWSHMEVRLYIIALFS